MTLDEARKIVASFPPEFNSLALPGYYFQAKGLIEGHAIGQSEERKRCAEIVHRAGCLEAAPQSEYEKGYHRSCLNAYTEILKGEAEGK